MVTWIKNAWNTLTGIFSAPADVPVDEDHPIASGADVPVDEDHPIASGAGGGSPDFQTGLIAHWKLDDKAGTVASDSAGSNNGALVGTPNWGVGQIGGAFDFVGWPLTYFNCGTDASLDNTSEGSVTAWVKPRSLGTESGFGPGYIFQRWSVATAGYAVRCDPTGGGFAWYSEPDGVKRASTSPLVLGSWSHVAACWAGTTLNLFLDAVPVGSFSLGAPVQGGETIPTAIGIVFDGLLDDIRLYDRILSEGDIAGLYLAGQQRHRATNPMPLGLQM